MVLTYQRLQKMPKVVFYILKPSDQGSRPEWLELEDYELEEVFWNGNTRIQVTEEWAKSRAKHLSSNDVFDKKGNIVKCGGYGRPVTYKIHQD